MIFSCPAKVPLKKIRFTIQNPSGQLYGAYEAEQGMIWKRWVDSPYNVDAYRIFDNLGLKPGNEDRYGAPPFVVTADSEPGFGSVIIDITINDAITDKAYDRVAYSDDF